jgi:hypothetical protein
VTLTSDGEFKGEKDFESQFRDVDSMGAKMKEISDLYGVPMSTVVNH